MKQLWIAVGLVACAAPASPVTPTPPANKFAMRTYTFVLLRRGPAWSLDETPESKAIFEGHMANIRAMGKAGKLVLAGPFDAPAGDKTAYAGLFVLDVKSDDEARAWLAKDPAVQSGRFVPELRPWYGPAGITARASSRRRPVLAIADSDSMACWRYTAAQYSTNCAVPWRSVMLYVSSCPRLSCGAIEKLCTVVTQ